MGSISLWREEDKTMTMPKKENTGAIDDFTVDEGDIADTEKKEDTDKNR